MDITATLALWLRVYLLYPLVGIAASASSGLLVLNQETGHLILDLNAASFMVAGLVVGGGSGAIFAGSRWLKARGWAT